MHGALNNWHPTNPDRYQKSTQYLLNSLSYGWWLDEVYASNEELLQNPAVNAVAEIGRSFAPVEAGPTAFKAADTFVLTHEGTTYVAAFNYGTGARSDAIDLARLGLDPAGTYAVTELWTGAASTASGSLGATVPGEDARIYTITRT